MPPSEQTYMVDQRIILPLHDLEGSPPPRPLPTAPPLPYGQFESDFAQPPKKRKRCCRCLCWTICLFLLLIIVIGITAAIFYFTYHPKPPNYYVNYIQISEFNVNSDSGHLSATFAAKIHATNPNEKIGIHYERGSSVSVRYAATNTKICEGFVPEFYQGRRNTTVLVLPFAGETEDGVALMATMTEEVEEYGDVLLDLRVKQPVRIEIGKWTSMKVNVLVKCEIYVVPDDPMWIDGSSCKIRVRV